MTGNLWRISCLVAACGILLVATCTLCNDSAPAATEVQTNDFESKLDAAIPESARAPTEPAVELENDSKTEVVEKQSLAQRLRGYVGKMFDFDSYARAFDKHYPTWTESLRRKKLYLGRAAQVAASAFNYVFRGSGYYLSINHLSDRTNEELQQMSQRLPADDKRKPNQDELDSLPKKKASAAAPWFHVENMFQWVTDNNLQEKLEKYFPRLKEIKLNWNQKPTESDDSKSKESQKVADSMPIKKAAGSRFNLPAWVKDSRVFGEVRRRVWSESDDEDKTNTVATQASNKDKKFKMEGTLEDEGFQMVTLDDLIKMDHNSNFKPSGQDKIMTVDDLKEQGYKILSFDDLMKPGHKWVAPKPKKPRIPLHSKPQEALSQMETIQRFMRLMNEKPKKNLWVADTSFYQDPEIQERSAPEQIDVTKLPEHVQVQLAVRARNPTHQDGVHIDHRVSKCFGPPKNQKKCGACYAFAGMSLFEYGACMMTTKPEERDGNPERFSEQYLIDCGKEFGMNGCMGADYYDMAKFIRNYGLERDSDYRYEESQLDCPLHSRLELDKVGHIRFEDLPLTLVKTSDFDTMLHYGPILTNLLNFQDYSFFGGGVYDKFGQCETHEVYHAVVVVGSGRENGRDYYILRNSWGPNWGDQGYIKIVKDTDCLGHHWQSVMLGRFEDDTLKLPEFKVNLQHQKHWLTIDE